jgi:hypothetical protein
MKQLIRKPQAGDWGNPLAADDIDYKEVYFLEPDPFTEQGVLHLARTAFEAAGYDIRQAAKAPYHPVYIFRLRRMTAPRLVQDRDLRDHFHQVLSGVGLVLPKDAQLAQRNGDRLLVTFLWQTKSTNGARTRRTRRMPVG